MASFAGMLAGFGVACTGVLLGRFADGMVAAREGWEKLRKSLGFEHDTTLPVPDVDATLQTKEQFNHWISTLDQSKISKENFRDGIVLWNDGMRRIRAAISSEISSMIDQRAALSEARQQMVFRRDQQTCDKAIVDLTDKINILIGSNIRTLQLQVAKELEKKSDVDHLRDVAQKMKNAGLLGASAAAGGATFGVLMGLDRDTYY